MARVVRFHQHGGPEVLQIEELDVPAPGHGQVQIRVEAIGLNRAEVLFRQGTYIEPHLSPPVLDWRLQGSLKQLEETWRT